MTWTTPTSPQLFFKKNDPEDPRLGEIVTSQPLKTLQDLDQIKGPSWLILGYPDDAGIYLNGGRLGASEAPSAIRSFFYKMTPSLLENRRPLMVDLGDICKNAPLPERHEKGREIIRAALQKGHRTVSLGGGHDYGYADGAGFMDAARQGTKQPVIINFDAHLDVRPSEQCLSSGTPFYRLLNQYPDLFSFFEIGLQSQCNSQAHLQWAQKKGARFLHMRDIRHQGLMNGVQALLQSFAGRPCFLSIDIDAFTSSEAPGCSQSWATGINVEEFLPVMAWLQGHLKVQSMAIYEVSPPLDVSYRTSKLAALLMHHFLFHPEALR